MRRLARDRDSADGLPAVQPEAARVPASWPTTTSASCWTRGWCATVNSDDPAYFGGYLNDNFIQTFAATAA